MRRVMGHCQFGARVEYGDCLFLTVSPNEQHSALVLRLSRYSKKDPSIVHGEQRRQDMAGVDHPRTLARLGWHRDPRWG